VKDRGLDIKESCSYLFMNRRDGLDHTRSCMYDIYAGYIFARYVKTKTKSKINCNITSDDDIFSHNFDITSYS
jgi:hypothetical protein